MCVCVCVCVCTCVCVCVCVCVCMCVYLPYILTQPAQNAARKKQVQWTCYTQKYTNMYYTVVVGFSLVSIKMSSGYDAE